MSIQSASKKLNKTENFESWFKYSPLNDVLPSTRFIPFKTPLKNEFFESNHIDSSNRFSVTDLIEKIKQKGYTLGIVIDLSTTTRYCTQELNFYGVQYFKLKCKLNSLKSNSEKFIEIVNEFLRTNSNEKSLIGVHCLHGLNRTGYMICAYLIKVDKVKPEEAIKSFEMARGHKIENTIKIICEIENN